MGVEVGVLVGVSVGVWVGVGLRCCLAPSAVGRANAAMRRKRNGGLRPKEVIGINATINSKPLFRRTRFLYTFLKMGDFFGC